MAKRLWMPQRGSTTTFPHTTADRAQRQTGHLKARVGGERYVATVASPPIAPNIMAFPMVLNAFRDEVRFLDRLALRSTWRYTLVRWNRLANMHKALLHYGIPRPS